MDVQVIPIPTNIIILVLAMILWALAFVRLAFGFRTIVDTKSGIQVPWIQIGWVVFAWAFLIVSFWPVLDILMQEEWVFSDLLLMVIGGLLFFLAAAAIAPDGTYKNADGEARYLEVAPIFFGLFAAYQVWLVFMDNVFFGGADAVRIGLWLVRRLPGVARLHGQCLLWRCGCGADRFEHWCGRPVSGPGIWQEHEPSKNSFGPGLDLNWTCGNSAGE